MLKDVHFTIGNTRATNLAPSEDNRRAYEHLTPLYSGGHIEDLVRRALNMAAHERCPERFVADTPLSAGINYRVHANLIH